MDSRALTGEVYCLGIWRLRSWSVFELKWLSSSVSVIASVVVIKIPRWLSTILSECNRPSGTHRRGTTQAGRLGQLKTRTDLVNNQNIRPILVYTWTTSLSGFSSGLLFVPILI